MSVCCAILLIIAGVVTLLVLTSWILAASYLVQLRRYRKLHNDEMEQWLSERRKGRRS